MRTLAVAVAILLSLPSRWPQLFAAATNTTVVLVDCSRADDVVVQSSTTYVLNCTQPQPGYRSFVEPTGGINNLSHVAVHATGGNILPRWVMDSGGSLENVSLRLTNLYIPGPAAFNASSLPLLTTPLFSAHNRSRIDAIYISLENVTLYLASNLSDAAALFAIAPPHWQIAATVGATPVRNVSFLVHRSTVAYNVSTGGPTDAVGLSLFSMTQRGNMSRLTVDIANSTIAGTGTMAGFVVAVVKVGTAQTFIANVDVAVRRSTILQTWACSVGDGQPSRCLVPEPGGLFEPLGGVLFMDPRYQKDVRIVVSDLSWYANTTTFPAPYRVGDELFLVALRADAAMERAAVRLERIHTEARATRTITLVALRSSLATHVDVAVTHGNVSMHAHGAIAFNEANRATAVLRCYAPPSALSAMVFMDSVVLLKHIAAHMRVLSGETEAFAIASSSFVNALVVLALLSGVARNSSFLIDACAFDGAVVGGTAPPYRALPMTVFSTSVWLTGFLTGGETSTTLSVTVRDSMVRADVGFSVTTAANAANSVMFVTSSCAIVAANANCTDCTFAIYNSRVDVVAMSFRDLPPRTDVLGALNAYNITSVFQVVSGGDLLSTALSSHPLYALMPPSITKELGQRVQHVRVHVTLQNATAAYDPRLPARVHSIDLLALVVPGESIAEGSIVVTGPSGSGGDPRLLRNQPSAMATFGRCDITRTSINVTDAAALGFAALLQVSAGSLRIAHAHIRMANIAVLGNPHASVSDRVAMAAYGSTSSGETFDVTTTNTSIIVADCTFSNMTSLVHPSRVTLSSLTLGCNLWDGVPLPLAVIGGVPLERIAYQRSTYVGDGIASGIVCKGIQTLTHSPSLAATQSTQRQATPAEPSKSSAAASTVASVATFVSALGPVVPRSAVGAVQGVLGLLRLAAACGGHATTGINVGNAEDATDAEGAAALDNPLQLSISVDTVTPELRHAAGAVVGNTVFVVAVAAVLHACARAYQHVEQSLTGQSSAAQRLVLDFFPKTMWPGCLLVPLGVLLEPVAKMAVLLMALGGSAAGALGGVLLAVWVSTVLFFAYRLLRIRPFPMRSVATRTLRRRRMKRSTSEKETRCLLRLKALRSAMQWATEPTEFFAPPRRPQHREYAALLEVHYACAYEPYKAPYVAFFLVEYGSTVLVGVLLGAATSVGPASACSALRWCGWLVAALYVAVVAASVALRPFAVRSDTIATTLIQGLCAASAVAAALSSDDGDSSGQDAAEALALAASCVELVAVAVGIANGVMARVLRLSLRQGVFFPEAADFGGHRAFRGARTVALAPRQSRLLRRLLLSRAGSAAVPLGGRHDAAAALGALVALICEQQGQLQAVHSAQQTRP